MKRKQRTSLPRLTVLAMSRKELQAFTTAVQDLRTIKLELAELVDQLGKRTAKKPRKPVVPPMPTNVGIPFPPYPREESTNGTQEG